MRQTSCTFRRVGNTPLALQPKISAKTIHQFPGTGSLFARTLERASAISATAPLVISSRRHGFLCRKAARQLGLEAHYILEETGRNTAPAIYFAALASDPDDILLIMPSDHWIEDLETFTALAMRGVEICKTGVWLTFGITPTAPATGYGYIEADARVTGLCDVRSFTEKPDLATAKKYLASGRHFWNSGIFMVQAVPALRVFIATSRDSARLRLPVGRPALNAPTKTFLPGQILKPSRRSR